MSVGIFRELLSRLAWLIVYAGIPLYAFGLVVRIGMRDFSTIFNFHQFAHNSIRKLF
ncbi:hypothetical protein BH10ACI2_BH10ACI2_02430 [soil metagenome]